ncbi:magnesium-translocating P-type ATPase [Lancefieldella parvula DSM 20469]|uniref:Magnesium-transporting ATPase, P-type 1 n=1 Tax=Lancefieldella parvula (strain ATCC 33793 / DSM 20469 / CCUG 32760 / JCM 10300 / KCTC 3663 / VPI 0546 / 1246) TaxID=521095 RepID=C8W832_LANP1|nr:magnesium-translocating P-type ATPase [Lancefieldella parvula]ACV51622.1 magnesium-translocating P-type ATPase [Lancefieldella parvula DSM 20469]
MTIMKRTTQTKTTQTTSGELGQSLTFAATHSVKSVCRKFHTTPDGLAIDIAQAKYDLDGPNVITGAAEEPFIIRLLKSFASPFTFILIALAGISYITNVVLATDGEKDPSTVIIITSMVFISGIIDFVQSSKGASAAAALSKMVTSTTRVIRRPIDFDDLATDQDSSQNLNQNSDESTDELKDFEDEYATDETAGESEDAADEDEASEPKLASALGEEIPFEQVVIGDIIRLASGDMIPADCRVLDAKDLFVNETALTGESEPVEKTAGVVHARRRADGTRYPLSLSECTNLLFAGTTVQSGSATVVVVATGNKTYVGTMSEMLQQPSGETSFDEGLKSVSKVLVSFMLIMCPIVFFANGFLKGDWFDALLFSVSVAVGITPQMLPVIVTTCLSRGGTQMAKQDVIVKNPAAIQNLGAMDILCTDKTGTITADEVVLERHLNILGEEDARVLRHAYLNSYFQTGLRNLIDKAIIKTSNDELPTNLLSIEYEKIDEVPFDFERRRMSVVVRNTKTNKTQMITKGAVEEVLNACSFVDLDSEIKPLTPAQRKSVMDRVYQLNQEGMRVVGVAQKSDPRGVGEFGVDDERDMVLIGYLAFLDPPKESAREAIAKLNQRGVQVKVLTGDNEGVAAAVCKKVGIHVDELLLGSDVENLNDEQLKERVEKTQLFAKLSPMQKARVVSALRSNNHVVGFMGDGINDAAAMRSSDVGISVDTAVDVAKESADIILLQKDLLVLEHGVEEGRRTYGNTIKYIKATASSNFGNVLSVLVASFFLPFLPMSALQLLLLGLVYTVTCIAIPWDNVDDSFLSSPRSWDAHSITNFMLWIGPISSIFDVLTFALMFFMVSPTLAGGTWAELTAAGNTAAQTLFILSFQTGWFIESMWTQTFVLHALRTNKIPFVQSMPSASLLTLTTAGIVVVSALPYLPVFAQPLSLVALPLSFFGWLIALMSGYMVLITIIKSLYVKRFGSLL